MEIFKSEEKKEEWGKVNRTHRMSVHCGFPREMRKGLRLFEEIRTENFPNLMEDIINIQKVQQTLE